MAVALWSLASVMTGYAGSFTSLLVWRAVLGLAESAAIPASNKAYAFLLPPRERQIGSAVQSISPEALELLQRYEWPGNLDEMQRVIQEATAAAADPTVKLADLPFRFRTALQAQDTPPTPPPRILPLDDMLTRVETNAIQLALERSRYNKTKAADLLGINRARLYRRMEQLGIEDREPDGGLDSPVG